jgi:hypothetical protein
MQRDWVSVWVFLLALVWLCSAWCWLAPSVPGVWGQVCAPQHARDVSLARWLALLPLTVPAVARTASPSRTVFLIRYAKGWSSSPISRTPRYAPATPRPPMACRCARLTRVHVSAQMPENKQICETAGDSSVRRCRYVGTKIGEALRWVEDRDLLTMMLVFMCNTLVFVFSVSLRSSGHRCQRRKEDDEEDGVTGFDVDQFDLNTSLVPPDVGPEEAVSLANKVVGGIQKLRESRRSSAQADGLLSDGGVYTDAGVFEDEPRVSMASSPKATSASDKGQDAEEDSELDLAKVSLEMLGLVNIVRQPDEVVYVHCGADAYLYMKYQKYMINMLWVMFVTSVLVLLPNQYGKRESNDPDSKFLNTFYCKLHALLLHAPTC